MFFPSVSSTRQFFLQTREILFPNSIVFWRHLQSFISIPAAGTRRPHGVCVREVRTGTQSGKTRAKLRVNQDLGWPRKVKGPDSIQHGQVKVLFMLTWVLVDENHVRYVIKKTSKEESDNKYGNGLQTDFASLYSISSCRREAYSYKIICFPFDKTSFHLLDK